MTNRTQLEIAKDALEKIAKRPDLPNPDRDADWKNCMKASSFEAAEALAHIDDCEKRAALDSLPAAPVEGGSAQPRGEDVLSEEVVGLMVNEYEGPDLGHEDALYRNLCDLAKSHEILRRMLK